MPLPTTKQLTSAGPQSGPHSETLLIYVTGAAGFIGSRVTHRLLERGDRVRCLVRSGARGAALAAGGAELVVGDVADRTVHVQGLQHADAAIHLAAIYEIGIVDAAAMQRTNVAGTGAFLDAAAQAGTARIIHISSTAALGPARGALDEPVDAYAGPYHSEYHRTKAAAHGLARAAQDAGAPLIIICPSFVYGPGDEGPAGRFLKDIVRRKLPALLKTPARFSYVFVDDVVTGIISALDRGTPGATYILSGEAADMNDFAERAALLAGVKLPRLRIPVGVARALTAVTDPISRLTGIRFPITGEAVRTTSTDRWLHTHKRATRDLGYWPRGLAHGLPETVAWASAESA